MEIKIDGKKIEPSSHVKYLGIFTLMSYLLNFLMQLVCSLKLDTIKREDIFHGLSWNFFIPTSIWFSNLGRQSNQSVSKMEKLQNKALRIINFKPLRYSVNSLYNKCEILKFGDSIKLSNFLYAHDNIKGNLPTTLCAGITLLDSKHSQVTRNQKVTR